MEGHADCGFITIRNYITLKHTVEVDELPAGFITIRNYITLKLSLSSLSPLY